MSFLAAGKVSNNYLYDTQMVNDSEGGFVMIQIKELFDSKIRAR